LQKLEKVAGEGAYVFLPEWEKDTKQFLYEFSQLDSNILYEGGKNIEQYTIRFNSTTTKEQAMLKVRFSPKHLSEIVQFQVELNGVQIDKENRGKDVVVRWKLFDGFNTNNTFYTDSNALGMVERKLDHRDYFKADYKYNNISSNYYPVDSAIAVRDANSSRIQVTVMNDRAQGGSAGVSGNGTIELMQHRRTTEDDNKGVQEPLNETDAATGQALKVTATYNMQIFDFQKGKSKQREMQIFTDQPPVQLFAFNYQPPTVAPMVSHKALAEFELVDAGEQAESDKVPLQSLANPSLTYHVFPLARNKILVRLTNLEDKLDGDQAKTLYVSVNDLANDFYRQANPSTEGTPAQFSITETTVGGV
jgi:hypothetical protein